MVPSASGSQIGPDVAGAGRLTPIISGQKLVPDLQTALQRVTEHVPPYENQRLREQMAIPTLCARILILDRDYRPGQPTVTLVRKPAGLPARP